MEFWLAQKCFLLQQFITQLEYGRSVAKKKLFGQYFFGRKNFGPGREVIFFQKKKKKSDSVRAGKKITYTRAQL